uniref:Fibronectin type-III domain-containing protein n=1 Tax=Heterorhabditis bacteriophora TaxID=37862 RepID=A0A1I7WQG9_HETBA
MTWAFPKYNLQVPTTYRLVLTTAHPHQAEPAQYRPVVYSHAGPNVLTDHVTSTSHPVQNETRSPNNNNNYLHQMTYFSYTSHSIVLLHSYYFGSYLIV